MAAQIESMSGFLWPITMVCIAAEDDMELRDDKPRRREMAADYSRTAEPRFEAAPFSGDPRRCRDRNSSHCARGKAFRDVPRAVRVRRSDRRPVRSAGARSVASRAHPDDSRWGHGSRLGLEDRQDGWALDLGHCGGPRAAAWEWLAFHRWTGEQRATGLAEATGLGADAGAGWPAQSWSRAARMP